jgi:hypothetical protein
VLIGGGECFKTHSPPLLIQEIIKEINKIR